MWQETQFKDRRDAGNALGERLRQYAGRDDVIILALPRGGVPVAKQVADKLGAPLDVFIVRKLGVPGQEELAFGAIATGGITAFNDDVLAAVRMPRELLRQVIESETLELERRELAFRGRRPPPDLNGKKVIVVDDGLATGATMAAAVKAIKQLGPAELIVAAPVASRQACDEIERTGDVKCICAATPEPFYGVGMWYEDFTQTSDSEVQEILGSSKARDENAKAQPAGR